MRKRREEIGERRAARKAERGELDSNEVRAAVSRRKLLTERRTVHRTDQIL
jgi:hypothetical protein